MDANPDRLHIFAGCAYLLEVQARVPGVGAPLDVGSLGGCLTLSGSREKHSQNSGVARDIIDPAGNSGR
jgi:hypothetical protein